jgi:RNA polymerase sigma factor (sigma-70 family)
VLTTSTFDVGELYGSFAPRLERIVRLDAGAPEPVVEDACQFAWSRLIDRGDRIRRGDAVLAWLATTAIREARRLSRRDARELPLDDTFEPTARTPGPDELAELRERLRLIGWLPERQQRLLWLHALGLSYAEIAASTGCTTRTVERQLLRAKHRVRALAADGQRTLPAA